MTKWEGCIKIHENCGGVVRWVEAIEKPGVGYYGKCDLCGANGLPCERIIPIEREKRNGVTSKNIKELDIDIRRRLKWDNDSSWEENQERLKEEIKDA